MSKKKKGKKRKLSYDLGAYQEFSRKTKARTEEKMDKLQEKLDNYILDIEKADRKYEKLKKKVKKGKKSKQDLKEYRKTHMVGSRRKATEFLTSREFLENIGEIALTAKAVAGIIAQLVCALIVAILSNKKFRESIPIKVVRGMQATYDFCIKIT